MSGLRPPFHRGTSSFGDEAAPQKLRPPAPRPAFRASQGADPDPGLLPARPGKAGPSRTQESPYGLLQIKCLFERARGDPGGQLLGLRTPDPAFVRGHCWGAAPSEEGRGLWAQPAEMQRQWLSPIPACVGGPLPHPPPVCGGSFPSPPARRPKCLCCSAESTQHACYMPALGGPVHVCAQNAALCSMWNTTCGNSPHA